MVAEMLNTIQKFILRLVEEIDFIEKKKSQSQFRLNSQDSQWPLDSIPDGVNTTLLT